jgi:hypothetical protein
VPEPKGPQFTRVPDEMHSLVAGICAGLPEAECADNGVGYVLRIRRRSFGTLVAVVSADTGATQPLLVVLADREERSALLAIGHPYFRPPTMGSRIGVLLSAATDRTEIAELITEAYRQVAPKGLVAQLGEIGS